MRPPIYRKIYIGTAIAGFVIIMIFPDVIFGLLFEFVHFLFDLTVELANILLELIETTLDQLIEHFFHTDLHQTQVIVFYLMLIVGVSVGYSLLRVAILFCLRCANNLLCTLTAYKTRLFSYWHNLDLINKIRWIAISALGLYLIFLVSF